MVSPQPHLAARDAIAASGLRHRDVASQLGIDASKLSKSLSGVRRFSPTELERLATVTGAPLEALTAPQPESEALPNPRPSGAEFERQRRRIVDAAWKLFTTRGYQTVTIADIGAAAGMSTPAVHYYFHTKNEIFLATIDVCSRFAAERRASAHDIADPAERLLRFAEVQLDGSPDSRRVWTTWAQFWASSASFEDAKAATLIAYSRWQEELRSIVDEGVAAGQFVANDPEQMVDGITAMIDGFGVRMLAGVLTPEAACTAVTVYLRTWMTPETQAALREKKGT